MRPCHNHFLSFHIQNKVFHFTPLTQYIIVYHAKRRWLQRKRLCVTLRLCVSALKMPSTNNQQTSAVRASG